MIGDYEIFANLRIAFVSSSILHTAQLPLGGQHLGVVHQPLVGPIGPGSSVLRLATL